MLDSAVVYDSITIYVIKSVLDSATVDDGLSTTIITSLSDSATVNHAIVSKIFYWQLMFDHLLTNDKIVSVGVGHIIPHLQHLYYNPQS